MGKADKVHFRIFQGMQGNVAGSDAVGYGLLKSQPKKYRKKKECNCPKWNQRGQADPRNSVRPLAEPTASPYYCGPASPDL
jgi:hypothetical protein